MSLHQPFKALLIGPLKTPSFIIGILQPFNYLRKRLVCDYIAVDDEAVRKSDISAADIIIFSRTTKPQAYRYLQWALQMGKPVVYVIDDHFLAMPPSTIGGANFEQAAYRETFVKFLNEAHIVKVASAFFGEHLQQHFDIQQIVCFSGSIDFALLRHVVKAERTDDKLTIGYAGGDKDQAFIPVAHALINVLDKYKHVHFECIGFLPPSLQGHPRVTRFEVEPKYRVYLRRLYELNWDIGIAPLSDKLYHQCKSDNKFREYSACQIAGVYSDGPAFNQSVTAGKTGLLVANDEQAWYEALCSLIEQPQLRKNIAQQAHRYAKKHYAIKQIAARWQQDILDPMIAGNDNQRKGVN